MILPGSELMPMIRAALERGQRVRLTVNGGSMLPFIHNDDTVELEALRTPPRVGEIVLAQGTNGHYVVHRVIQGEGESFYLRGDAQTNREGPLTCEDIIGKVIHSERCGKVRNHARGIWRILGQIWVSIHPVGFYLFRMYLEFRRVGGKALRRLQQWRFFRH